MDKQSIREKIWNLMEKKDIARFPRPVFSRIPNFVGSEEAARKLLELKELQEAKILRINPDSPQRPVRELALKEGKIIYVGTPRFKKGFIKLDPEKCKDIENFASSIKGFFKHGDFIKLKDMKPIDMIITGSVAVDKRGYRCGKGKGYADLGYALSSELNLITPETPIATTVHPIQIVDKVPEDEYDVPVDFIVTADKIIKTDHLPRKKMKVFLKNYLQS